jgi:DNA (cytosine-5)-methyltransferase 1
MMRLAYYNDVEPFACDVLRARIADGHLPHGVVECRDIRDVQADDLVGFGQIHLFAGIGGGALACRLAGVPDDFPIITNGFPCTNISLAGDGTGLDGEDSRLFYESIRLIRPLGRHYVLMENVAALLARGLDRVLGEVAALGRDAAWACVSAADVGATHERDRLWIVAYPNHDARERRSRADVDGSGWRAGEAERTDHRRRDGEARSDHAGSRREGVGVGQVDSDGRPRTSGARGSSVGDRAEVAGVGDAGDAVGVFHANRAGREELHAPAVADRARFDPRPTASHGAVADRDADGRCGQSSDDCPHRGVAVEPRHDADRRDDHGERAVGREADAGRDGARSAQSAVGGAAHGLPLVVVRGDFPAAPGEAQHGWEAPRLVPSLDRNGRRSLAAYGNAWVPRAAIPALHHILAHADALSTPTRRAS